MVFEIKPGLESPEVRNSSIYSATRQQLDIDLPDLFDHDPRPNSAGYLIKHGWSAEICTPFDFTRHNCGLVPEPNDALASNRWIFAEKLGRESAGRNV